MLTLFMCKRRLSDDDLCQYASVFCIIFSLIIGVVIVTTTCNIKMNICASGDITNVKCVEKKFYNISDNDFLVNIIYETNCSVLYEFNDYLIAMNFYNQPSVEQYYIQDNTKMKNISGIDYRECSIVSDKTLIGNLIWWIVGLLCIVGSLSCWIYWIYKTKLRRQRTYINTADLSLDSTVLSVLSVPLV